MWPSREANVVAYVGIYEPCNLPYMNVFGKSEESCRGKLLLMGYTPDDIDELFSFQPFCVTEDMYNVLP